MRSQPPSLVIHVPHAATAIPADVRPTLLLDDDGLERELLAMTDRYTDELFAMDPALACTVYFPVSRLVVDPERFENDEHEEMAVRGMGAVYTRTSDGRPLRGPVSSADREQLIERYYRPHHAALETATAAALASHNLCLIVDAHSFPSRPLPYEDDQDPDRPDVCIGTDPFHTPEDGVEPTLLGRTRSGALLWPGSAGRVHHDRDQQGPLHGRGDGDAV